MDPIEDDSRNWDDDLGEPVDGLPMVDPVTGKKILRPRNAWILYRNARLDDVQRLPDGSRQPMAEASKVISRWWKAEAQEVKVRYELEAEKEKAEHRRKYPHYRFQPKSKQQKQREQAARKEAKKKMQLATKKARARGLTPPPFYPSHQTSYVAAALANQAATSSSSQASTHPLRNVSPPLSLASTPFNGPSPISSSDIESSSYSTSATSPLSASPSSAMGLGLLPPMTFSGQEAANARVPQHSPVRLPPRPKGPRHVSSSTSTSRVRSSSTVTPPTPPETSPASSSNMLSPLPWPPIQQQPSPEPEGISPPLLSAVPEESSATLDAWLNESAYEAVPDTSGAVSIELDFPPSFDLNEFSDIFDPTYLPSLGASDHQGVFQVSAESFMDSAPGQIDVSLASGQQAPNVTTEEREAFTMLLRTFDFNSVMNDGDPTRFAREAGPSSLNYDASSNGAWGNLNVMDMVPLSGIYSADDLLASYALQDSSEQSFEQDRLDADTGNDTSQSTSQHQQQQQSMQPPLIQPQPHTQLHQPQPQRNYPVDIPPELAQNPVFQNWFSRIASPQQYATEQPSCSQVPTLPQSLPQQQQYLLTNSLTRRDPSSSHLRPPTPPHTHLHSIPNPAVTLSLPVPDASKSAYSSSSTGPFVPPPGANRTHTRRVAGSWKPPIPLPPYGPWATPTTPDNVSSQEARSWGGAS